MGLLPAGSHANKHFCDTRVSVADGLSPVRVDLMFDAQTSGGLVLSVPEDKLAAARSILLEAGDLAAVIGTVLPAEDSQGILHLV